MKLFQYPLATLLTVCLSACITPAPLGTHYELGSLTPKPNDNCASYYVNQAGPLSLINASVGQPRGVSQAVASISDSRSITISDAKALAIPVSPAGSIQGIACYATLRYQAGGTEKGVLTAFRSDPGQEVRVMWISQQALEEARETQDAQDEQSREHLREEQRQAIAYSEYLQACTLEWKVAIEAKARLRAGQSQEAVEQDLINRHAYGPGGQVYRDSEDVAAMIHQVVDAVVVPPDVRNQNHIPDYASHQFLADCPGKAREATRKGP